MVSEETADIRARMQLIEDFEAIALIPRLGSKAGRVIEMRVFLSRPIEQLRQLVNAIRKLSEDY